MRKISVPNTVEVMVENIKLHEEEQSSWPSFSIGEGK
jgi:hypothetical protein